MRIVILAAAAAFLSACGGGIVINPRYQPGPLATPYAGRKPRIYLGNVSDKSGAVRWGNSAVFPNSVPRPLEECLREAFVNEFKRLDIPLVGAAKDADAQISASWRETIVNLDAGISVADKATVRIGLDVKGRGGAPIYDDEIVGKGVSDYHHIGCCPGKGPGQAVEAALGDAMKKFEELFEGDLAEQILSSPAATGPVAVAAATAPSVKSDIDEVPTAKLAPRKGHAIVIGVERYRGQLPDADFAAEDAKLVGKYLTQALGYSKENVAVLTNEGAARTDLEKYLERWLPNRVEPGDPVFVYFSGHGSPNPATGDAYLVPYDGDPAYLEQTAYPLERLYRALAKLPTKDVTVVLDSCFSGAGGRSVIAKGARPLVSVHADAGIPESITVLSASAGNQISQSYQAKGHGLFTYFFLKGVGQQAGGAYLDMRKVYDFAAPAVARVARQEFNSEQEPQWHGGAH